MSSFFYNRHSPTFDEYYASKWQYDLRFMLPYAFASLVVVGVCSYLAPALAAWRRLQVGFLRHAVISFALIGAATGTSDLLTRAGILKNALFFTGDCLMLATHLGVAAMLAITAAFLRWAVGRPPTR